MSIKRLAVYCGSAAGADPAFADTARELGRLMVERDIDLVYGGGKLGLMGIVADTVLGAGGKVYGVIPDALVAHTAEWLPAHSELSGRVYTGLTHSISEEELRDVHVFLTKWLERAAKA